MNCPNCKDRKLFVLRTLIARDDSETRDLKCLKCGFRASSVTFLVDRSTVKVGQGAAEALRKMIRQGKIKSPLEDPVP